MGLTNKKEDQLKNMPVIESRLRKSKDGRLLIHQTIITHIKPANYYRAVLDSPVGEDASEVVQQPVKA
ncbi:MAG: hypothetical protein ACE5DM_00940 [Candidatus Nanoarchaeia archaeon]